MSINISEKDLRSGGKGLIMTFGGAVAGAFGAMMMMAPPWLILSVPSVVAAGSLIAGLNIAKEKNAEAANAGRDEPYNTKAMLAGGLIGLAVTFGLTAKNAMAEEAVSMPETLIEVVDAPAIRPQI